MLIRQHPATARVRRAAVLAGQAALAVVGIVGVAFFLWLIAVIGIGPA